MNNIMRLSSMAALIATTGLLATGCECQDQGTNSEGQSVTECESVKKFVGTSFSDSETYTSGMDIRFSGVNGNVEIRVGGTDTVSAEFTPFSVRGHSKSEEAAADMENDLTADVLIDGNTVVIDTDRASGSFNGLGADVVVTIPSNFDGALVVNQNNGFVDVDLGGTSVTSVTIDNDGAGDIDVNGARGPLDIKGGFDIDVDVAEWAADGQNGTIISDGQLGDVSISLPTASAGSIQAISQDGVVIGPSPLPENWVEEGEENSKTFSFGIADPSEPGAIVQVEGAKDVTITAE